MYQKEIKTKAAAAKVAKSIKEDVEAAIGFLCGYNTVLEKRTNDYQVQVTSSSSCVMLTGTVLGYLFQLSQMYQTQYRHICYEVCLRDDKPAFIIEVSWS